MPGLSRAYWWAGWQPALYVTVRIRECGLLQYAISQSLSL